MVLFYEGTSKDGNIYYEAVNSGDMNIDDIYFNVSTMSYKTLEEGVSRKTENMILFDEKDF